MDKFHRRIDRTEAERMRIREFLRNIPSSKSTVEWFFLSFFCYIKSLDFLSSFTETEKDDLASLIASFNVAWNLVRLSLDQQGMLRLAAFVNEYSWMKQVVNLLDFTVLSSY